MKTTKQINKQHKKVYAEIAEMENKQSRNSFLIRQLFDALKAGKIDKAAFNEKYEQISGEQDKIAETLPDKHLMLRVLVHNYRVALFAEALPVILDTFRKYDGKPYGEKTRAKIRDEIKERTGCYCYLDGYRRYDSMVISDDKLTYSSSLRVYFRDGATDIDILPGNKINTPDISQARMNNSEYIKNPTAYIKKIRRAHMKAYKAQQELEKACKEYNSIVPHGMNWLEAGKVRCYIEGCY